MDGIRRGLGDKPGAGIGMSFMQDHDGAQSHRLQAARIQEGRIHASCELSGQDVFRKTHTLAPFREGGGRIRIGDPFIGQGFIDGGHLHFRPVHIPGLITVQRRTARPVTEPVGRMRQHGPDGGMVGQDIRGGQFGHVVNSFPEVVRQQRHRILFLG